MVWSKEMVLELLDLYQKEPVIWNTAHNLHRNRDEREAGWKRIQNQYSKPFTVDEFKRKKASIMSEFRKCRERIKAYQNYNLKYKPKWFAYEKMDSFLREIYEPRTTVKTEDTDSFTSFDTTRNVEDADSEVNTVFAENELPKTEAACLLATEDLNPSPPKKRKIVWEDDELERIMDEAYHILRISVRDAKTKKDEFDIFGELIAEKLLKMDQETRYFAMNKINNILFDLKPNLSSENTSTDLYTVPPSSSTYFSQQLSPSFQQVFLSSSIK